MFGRKKYYGQIYKITYPGDPHYYYGQTVQGIEKRFEEHLHNANNDCPYYLHQWLRDLPDWDYLSIEIVNEAHSRKELDNLEKEIINDLWKTDPYCLNMVPGGSGLGSGEDHPSTKYSNQIINYILLSDRTANQLSSELGIGAKYIRSIRRNDKRVSDRSPLKLIPRSGEDNGSSKNSFYSIFLIRLFCQNYKTREVITLIEEEVGISNTPEMTRYIIRNKNWYDPNWDPRNRVYTGKPKGYDESWGDWSD